MASPCRPLIFSIGAKGVILMDNFYSDLNRGKVGEALAAKALVARGHKVIDVSDNWDYRRKDIDFVLTNKQGQTTTLEVKTDAASENTGNVFIEYGNINNKTHNYLGWLMYCEAEYIGFVQPHNKKAMIVSFDELKQNIKENSYRSASSYNATGFLMPITTLQGFNSFFLMDV